jgi:hypothetical protein
VLIFRAMVAIGNAVFTSTMLTKMETYIPNKSVLILQIGVANEVAASTCTMWTPVQDHRLQVDQ